MNTRSLARMLPVALLGLALVTFTVWGVAGCQTGGGTGGNANANTEENENENIADNENENANTAGNENTNTPAPDGVALYESNCQACHGADGGDVVGFSAAEITQAIGSVALMRDISLTQEEIAAIAELLAQ
jgi:mono/diheme cytochrome c family protein